MSVSASLAFTQGAQVGAPGVAIIGVDGTLVVASNGNNANVMTWTFTMVDVPQTSALPTGVVQTGSSPTYSFTPDVTGGYLLLLTVYDSFGNFAQDFRTFQVPEASGRIIPPFKGTDQSLNFIISSVQNTRGWAIFQDAYDREVDYLASLTTGVPVVKTSSFTASPGGVYYVNTTSGPISVQMPVMSAGGTVEIVDYGQSCATHAITVLPPSGWQIASASTYLYGVTNASTAMQVNGESATWGSDGISKMPLQ
jgi:hypothetical protein